MRAKPERGGRCRPFFAARRWTVSARCVPLRGFRAVPMNTPAALRVYWHRTSEGRGPL